MTVTHTENQSSYLNWGETAVSSLSPGGEISYDNIVNIMEAVYI